MPKLGRLPELVQADTARPRLPGLEGARHALGHDLQSPLVLRLRALGARQEARALADQIFNVTQLPDKAVSDALHLALSAVNGMDFLAKWNCTHIANAVVLKVVNRVCGDNGYEPPIVCTPEELVTP